ncbi:hypothetical protein ACFE04_009468 [Oxalis oulophora]
MPREVKLKLAKVARTEEQFTSGAQAYYADTQLHEFVSRNQRLKEAGKPVVINLDNGLWQYSRHPNYFGEQLWWFSCFCLELGTWMDFCWITCEYYVFSVRNYSRGRADA